MDIRLASDLHLEFKRFYLEKMPGEENTVLILAGDVFPVRYLREALNGNPDFTQFTHVVEFFADVCSRHRHVFYVFGNHEYYDGNFHREQKWFKDTIKFDNLTVLEQEDFVLDDVAFIGATLFTDFDKGNPQVVWDARRSMNDYYLIEQDDVFNENGLHVFPAGRLMPETIMEYHGQARHKVFRMVRKHKNEGRKVVVISHHGPTELSLDGRFKTGRRSELNYCYVSNMADEILNHGVDRWVHGHTHQNHRYEMGECVVHCNPRGYNDENPSFAFDYVFEV